MTGPWSAMEIERARSVPLLKILHHICDYVKEDPDYKPRDASSGSRRFQVHCNKSDFRLILTGGKWFDELADRGSSDRGGGGGIDLVMHLTGVNFVQAVHICLESLKNS